MTTDGLPVEFERLRELARRAIAPIKPADESSEAEDDFLFKARRTEASAGLPPYYLVYFLLVELLGFKDLGRFEKIAWSVPLDLEVTAYLIDYRKFGIGIFGRDGEESEEDAKRIVRLVRRGVRAAQPFFRFMA